MTKGLEPDYEKRGQSFPPFETTGLANTTAAISAASNTIKEAFDGARIAESTPKLSAVGEAIEDALGRSNFGGLAHRISADGGALDGLAEQLGSITSGLGERMSARLADLDTANQALRKAKFNMGFDQDLISRLESQPDLQQYLDGTFTQRYPDLLELPLPELPPNPIFETNALLEKLSSDFEDMKAVTAATADVQEKQAALVAQLLAASVEGSKAQEKAAGETLRVARVSMWISLAAVILTLLGVSAQALL